MQRVNDEKGEVAGQVQRLVFAETARSFSGSLSRGQESFVKPKVIVDPHPRTVELLFNQEELKRLRSLATLNICEGGRMPRRSTCRRHP